jgi:hypothetical protein
VLWSLPAASRFRRLFSPLEILPVACLVPESRWSPGESHTEINRLSSAKAEIGFDFRIGEFRQSLAGYRKKAESGRKMVPIWHSGTRCPLTKPNKYRENKHFLNKA